MMSSKRRPSTIILASWLAECDQALADAEYLISRLGRLEGKANGDLAALRVRILALRAQLDLLGMADDILLR